MGFALGAPTIVSEVINGEAIIIDMQSGNYYSTEGLGTSLWLAATAGQDRATLIGSIGVSYPESREASADADTFLNVLLENKLLIEIASNGAIVDDLVGSIGAYVCPKLQRHSDMQDLIMLDPIHDVDAVGWPTRREDTAPFEAA